MERVVKESLVCKEKARRRQGEGKEKAVLLMGVPWVGPTLWATLL